MPSIRIQHPSGKTLIINSPDGSVPTEAQIDQMFQSAGITSEPKVSTRDIPAILGTAGASMTGNIGHRVSPILNQLRQAFQNTGVGMVRGIVEPVLKNVIARPAQTIEAYLTKNINNPVSFEYPFPEFLGGPIRVNPVQTIPQAIGAGSQTAALALSPAIGGAMYGGGQALEEQKPIPQIAGQAILGGTLGKILGIVSGEPLLTGRVGQFAKERIVPTLKSSAKQSYANVLAPTTKAERLISDKLTSQLIERKPFVWTRGGLRRAAERERISVNESLNEAWLSIPVNKKVSVRPILNKINSAQNELKVNGVLLEHNISENNILENLKKDLVNIADSGKTSPQTLRQYRQELDKYIAARRKGFAVSDMDTSALNGRRTMSNSIRSEIAKQYPDINKLNREYSFWVNMSDLLEQTIPKKKGVLGEIGGAIGEVAGNPSAGFLIKNLGNIVSENVAWNSFAGSIKARLASLLARGDLERAGFTLMGAMQEYNNKISRGIIGFKNRKPIKVKGSQDPYLQELWQNLASETGG